MSRKSPKSRGVSDRSDMSLVASAVRRECCTNRPAAAHGSEPLEGVLQVLAHGGLRDREGTPDLLVRQPAPDERQDLELALRNGRSPQPFTVGAESPQPSHHMRPHQIHQDRKSTRLNSSHVKTSYA